MEVVLQTTWKGASSNEAAKTLSPASYCDGAGLAAIPTIECLTEDTSLMHASRDNTSLQLQST